MEALPPTIEGSRHMTPVTPPPGSPDAIRNSHGAPAAEAAVTVPAAPQPIAQLDFLNPEAMQHHVPLDHPFNLAGQAVTEIVLRRLRVQEVALWNTASAQGQADAFELYAVMAGLPAEVLRGLEVEDGTRLLEKAQDFLPRWLRTDPASPEKPVLGGATS